MHKPLVLIVEDQRVNQKLASLHLEKLGCCTHAVFNGRDAVQACRDTAYSLILMDCEMPEMNGLEAVAQIRRQEQAGRRVPIISLTARPLTGDLFTSGIDDHMIKPVTSKKLQAILERWLGPDRAQAMTPLDALAVLQAEQQIDGDIQIGASSGFNSTADKTVHTESHMKESAYGKNSRPEVFSVAEYNRKIAEWSMELGLAVVQEIMLDFVNGMQCALDELDNYINEQDIEGVKATVHRVKGMCVSIYGKETMSLVGQLEKCAHDGDWLSTKSQTQYLRKEFSQFRRKIEHI